MGTGLSLWQCFGTRQREWLCNTGTVLHATGLDMFKWLCYVNFILIENRKREKSNLDYIHLHTNVVIKYMFFLFVFYYL